MNFSYLLLSTSLLAFTFFHLMSTLDMTENIWHCGPPQSKGEWIVNSWLAWHQYDEFSLGICTSFSSYDLSSRMLSYSTLRLLFLLNVLQVKRHFRVRRAMWHHIINQTKERSHFMSKMCDRKIKFPSHCHAFLVLFTNLTGAAAGESVTHR